MSARSHDRTRWLLAGASAMIAAGCAAHQSTHQSTGVASNQLDCPMSFTLTCDAKRPGATTETELANCRCVRQREIDEFLRRY